MGIRILNLSKLAPALVAVALLDFAAVARADAGSAPTPVPASATATAVEASNAATPKPDPSAAAVGSADAQGPSSALKEASQRDAHGEAVSGPQPEATAADPGRAREPSSTQAAQMSGTSISEAVHEAIRQATTGRPDGSGSGDEVTVAADSNATAQLIWQVQVSECSAHCFGTRQSQRAEQQNTTLQVLTGAQPTATDPATGGRARETTRVTQVQLGCISHCFGSSTTSSSPDSSTYQRVLEETLREIAAGLPSLGPTPALAQNTVEQASYQSQSGQSQSGAGQTLTQTQGASQANTTIQLYEAPASLIAGLETALGRAAATQNAVNQTEQGIWQLQIGCLAFCRETEQYQQAEQSNTTVEALTSPSDSASAAAASVADITAQVTWQAQIGCLFWCLDATEQQTATTRNVHTVIETDGASAQPPAEATPTSSGAAAQGATPAPPTGSSAPAISSVSPAPGSATSVPSSTPAARSTTTAHKRGVLGARSHILSTRASESAPLSNEPARASLPEEAARRVPPRWMPSRAGSLAAGTVLPASAVSNVPAVAVLAAIALCALCLVCIALVRARSGSSANNLDA
jgi:hypothetical protein